MVDLYVMSRDTVVKEGRGEHHVISSVPELWVVLGVEIQGVTHSDESEPGDDQEGQPEVHEEARIVQGTVAHSHESGEDWSHDRELLIDLHPEVVDHFECSVEGVLTVLTRSNLDSFEYSSNKAASLGEPLVDEVLNGPNVFEEPSLKPY